MNSFDSKRRDLLRVGSLGVAGAAADAVYDTIDTKML
jgi:hypothetical protein